MCVPDSNPEAQRLRQRAVVLCAGAASMSGVAALSTNGYLHRHQPIVWGVIALQIFMFTKALHLISQRRRLQQQDIR